MFDISPVQIVIVLAIALLIFGPKRLPEMGRGLGRGIRDFKSGITGEDSRPVPTQTHTPAEPQTSEGVIGAAAGPENVQSEPAETHGATPAGVR